MKVHERHPFVKLEGKSVGGERTCRGEGKPQCLLNHVIKQNNNKNVISKTKKKKERKNRGRRKEGGREIWGNLGKMKE